MPASPPVKLSVNYVKQVKRTSCWYASACMVCQFRQQGPVYGDPESFLASSGFDEPPLEGDPGLAAEKWGTFAEKNGLKAVPGNSDAVLASGSSLAQALNDYGPLWVAGTFFSGAFGGHVVVLSGVVDDKKVIIQDPAPEPNGGPNKEKYLNWVREKMFRLPNSMLYAPAKG